MQTYIAKTTDYIHHTYTMHLSYTYHTHFIHTSYIHTSYTHLVRLAILQLLRTQLRELRLLGVEPNVLQQEQAVWRRAYLCQCVGVQTLGEEVERLSGKVLQ